MRRSLRWSTCWVAVSMIVVSPSAGADALLTPGDKIIAIDLDPIDVNASQSSYPAAESPAQAIDGLYTQQSFSKYLNRGNRNSGFIVTPSGGASIVKSIRIVTANDTFGRDPTSFELFGTNEAIVSADNSRGVSESWTLIATGALNPSAVRYTPSVPVNFGDNATSYTAYKVLFPMTRNATEGLMQVAEVELYTQIDGGGMDVLVAGSPILAVDRDLVTNSSYPSGERAAFLIDNRPSAATTTVTKFLNFGKLNTGCIVTPWVGPTVVTSFQVTTANDAPERDPASYTLYGTNDPVLSQDNGEGNLENWTLIASGSLALPEGRNVAADPVEFGNTVAYTSYRLVFPTLKNADTANSMQIDEVQFYGTIVEPQPTRILGPQDAIIAIDRDDDASESQVPASEEVVRAIDGRADQKYLNFGQTNSGLIVTPSGGASIIKSLRLTAANDAVERDPTSFELYGSNAPIVSMNNSLGNKESWTLIASGAVDLPTEPRLQAAPVVNFDDNTIAYLSYKIVFPTVRDAEAANSMQIGEVECFTAIEAGGTDVLVPGSFIIGIDTDPALTSDYPPAEGPANVADRTLNKYLNFGRARSGFIVTPAAGASIVTSLRLTAADEYYDRDPMTYSLYGTNEPIRSYDNSLGNLETWTLISTGSTGLTLDRYRLGPIVTFENEAAYTSYRLVFDTLRNDETANSAQICEVEIFGEVITCPMPYADADEDGDVDMVDFAALQLCYGRTNLLSVLDCGCFDATGDQAITDLDVAEFEKCATGPGIAWAAEAAPECVP